MVQWVEVMSYTVRNRGNACQANRETTEKHTRVASDFIASILPSPTRILLFVALNVLGKSSIPSFSSSPMTMETVARATDLQWDSSPTS